MQRTNQGQKMKIGKIISVEYDKFRVRLFHSTRNSTGLQCEKDERQKRRQQKSGLDRRLRPVLARDINTTRCP